MDLFEPLFKEGKIEIVSPNEKEETTVIKAISLFSGMGGDTLGMENAGIKVVGFVEINQTFCNSHKHHHTIIHIIFRRLELCDIRQDLFLRGRELFFVSEF